MKLLFDHNLSPRLVRLLADLYHGVWDYALQNKYAIVTRDSDYYDFTLLRGSPPKVIWIRRDNCSTKEIESIFRLKMIEIQEFFQNPSLDILILS